MNPFDYVWEAISTHPFNALTLLIAAGAAVYSGIQAMEARKTRKLNERLFQAQNAALEAQKLDTTRTAQLAERSAEASEKSAKAAKDLVHAGLRAWINVKSMSTPKLIGSLPSSVITRIENKGRTPARDLTVFHDWTLRDDAFPDRPNYSDMVDVSRGPLGPDGYFELKTSIPLDKIDATQRQKILEQALYLYVFGYVRYKDVFDEALWHITRWCLVWDPAAPHADFALHFHHNDVT